jgi:hypothetical protein
MLFRRFALALASLALVLFVGVGVGQDVKNTHEGKFVSAKGQTFKMEDKVGKEHSHTLTADAKIIGLDGKETRIEDLKRGQQIRVTTKEGDRTQAVKVEAMKPKNNN